MFSISDPPLPFLTSLFSRFPFNLLLFVGLKFLFEESDDIFPVLNARAHNAIYELIWCISFLSSLNSWRRRIKLQAELYASSTRHELCLRTQHPRYYYNTIQLSVDYPPLHMEYPALEHCSRPSLLQEPWSTIWVSTEEILDRHRSGDQD
jgi:hypothetical protein